VVDIRYALLALIFLPGCQFVSKTKFNAAQSQTRTLLEQQKAQTAEIENLKIHNRMVEDHLIRAEEEVARLNDRGGRRQASRGNGIPDGVSGRLADLARRYPSLQYDAETGISKLDTDVLFDSGRSELKGEVKQMLGEFAEIFASPEAKQLKIMVVGHTDTQGIKGREVRDRYPSNWHLSAGRALTVADYLKAAGIPEDRMGVAGFGQFQPVSPNDTAAARQKNRRVEIYLLGPETPVLGWNDAHGGLLR
jgi:chemotaxis protein MotB